MLINTIKETIMENKKKCIIILIIIIMGIIISIINKTSDYKKSAKVYKNSDIVFTYDEKKITDDISSLLPYVNLNSDTVSAVNRTNMTLFYETNYLDSEYMLYDYYLNNNVLSLIVKLYYNDANDFVPSNIDFYNIDLDTNEVIMSEELKSKFNITDEEVKTKLLELIKEYYDYEVKQGYINNCDFDCYIEPISDNLINSGNFYVKDNHLYYYRYFSIDYNFAYDENNPFNLFNFMIK